THKHEPDAVVVDRDLSGPGFALCQNLRADPALSAAAPIVVTQPMRPSRHDQVEALHAGAWHLQDDPTGSQELLARLGVYMAAKLEFDRLATECLIDRDSGLYNSVGFTQRAYELSALTGRQGLPTACAVFRPEGALPDRTSTDRVGRAFKAVGRLSDAIGRTAPAEFAVFAPATNSWAATRLIRRLTDQVVQEVGYVAEHGRRVALRAAFSAALPAQKVTPPVLLERARASLDA
ncbi:MAG TPA: hypothetical protein VG454_00505, partial [Gemmatimonadales bacterium]|nr:hypothetical protein [Gemmatimonadales bacterium]